MELWRFSRSCRARVRSCGKGSAKSKLRALTIASELEDEESVRVEHACKRYGRTQALSDLSFSLYSGELTVITGRNGSGKSTLLRVLSGFESLSSGRVAFAGQHPQVSGSSVFGDVASLDGVGYCA